VGQNEREWIGSRASFVDVVDPTTIDLGLVVMKLIQSNLLSCPIKFVLPVSQQVLKVRQASSVGPVGGSDFIGPARLCQAAVELVNGVFGNLYLEGPRLH
jgi:hypothetical protein